MKNGPSTSTHIVDEMFGALIDSIRTYRSVRDAIEIARRIVDTPEIGARFTDLQLDRLKSLVAQCDGYDKESGIHRVVYDKEVA